MTKHDCLVNPPCTNDCVRHHNAGPDTLDNLMKVHPPGTKFSLNGYRRQESFECHFYASGAWHGIYSDEQLRIYQEANGTCNGWSLLQEPKKRVGKWLWAYENAEDKWVLCTTYMSESEFIDSMYGRSRAIKLESTMI